MGSAEASIRAAIQQDGAISFARFMELALYSPGSGYYETHARTIGRRGDYFTSVSVGPVFGDCLALGIALEWARTGARPDGWSLLEAGAHDGRLALDILNSLKRRFPELYASVRYQIIEPSEIRRAWQRDALSEHSDRLSHVPRVEDLDDFKGVFLCNELFDAFPVHRFSWSVERQSWRELGVGESDGALVWRELNSPSIDFRDAVRAADLLLPDELCAALPDGYVLELCPSAAEWWGRLAARLREGYLATIDYGCGAGEWIQPERVSGTARAYSGHASSSDILAKPGERDLTSHVNFGALELAGRKAGLLTRHWARQGVFLSTIAREAVERGWELGWNSAELRQFQTLVHPQHLGHSFRVLVQQTRPAGQ
ncbi:MAG: SAM-dependent methyltransferase [Verrucomicrobia bacterium]|nr:SAM-dependent methyltransferase [Verrucomicrobiota bacterium]MBI3870206.1 SAM-dependent methyltransferase [Verrucomicrobiota bacterium]